MRERELDMVFLEKPVRKQVYTVRKLAYIYIQEGC